MAEQRLGAATAEVEAAWRTRLDELRQEQMHTASVGLQAVHAHSVRCLEEGRPVWTPEQKRRVGGSVLDDLLTASSKVQAYLHGPPVMSIRECVVEIIRGMDEEASGADSVERRFNWREQGDG